MLFIIHNNKTGIATTPMSAVSALQNWAELAARANEFEIWTAPAAGIRDMCGLRGVVRALGLAPEAPVNGQFMPW